MREACKRGRARQHEGKVRMLLVDSDGSGPKEHSSSQWNSMVSTLSEPCE